MTLQRSDERGARSEGLVESSARSKLAPRSSLLVPSSIRHVEIHDEIPSTNDRALQLTLFAALETPALIVARRQLTGRGRGTHAWWSADGALTLSLIIEPAFWDIAPRDWPKLSLTSAVAVCDALSSCVPQLTSSNSQSDIRNLKSRLAVKWPNDVLIDGAKVCGILIESPDGPPPVKDRVVIGVGINVNNSWHAAPPKAGPNGTALCDVTGIIHDIDAILVDFIEALDRRLRQLGQDALDLPRAWQQLSWLTGRQIEVDVGGTKSIGTCVGVADDGALLLRTPYATARIYSGSVSVTTG
jgi:BirA family transcriptional regulator, biotin operon repressor / biotin---[acetyl-CoA-carboxylase] ligase